MVSRGARSINLWGRSFHARVILKRASKAHFGQFDMFESSVLKDMLFKEHIFYRYQNQFRCAIESVS